MKVESAPSSGGYQAPPPAPKDKPLSKSEQQLVDQALKSPMPMDIGNMIKDQTNEAEKLA